MRARYYEPATGRFPSEDPRQEGQNWFAYAEGDPVNNTDRSGCVAEVNVQAWMWFQEMNNWFEATMCSPLAAKIEGAFLVFWDELITFQSVAFGATPLAGKAALDRAVYLNLATAYETESQLGLQSSSILGNVLGAIQAYSAGLYFTMFFLGLTDDLSGAISSLGP